MYVLRNIEAEMRKREKNRLSQMMRINLEQTHDDPEDPIFYSTCWVQQMEITFEGFTSEASDKPQPAPMSYKVADMCLPCAAVDGIPKLGDLEVPRWKVTRECSKCS